MNDINNEPLVDYDDGFINPSINNVGGIKIPIGDRNYRRITNVCLSDLLKHIQYHMIPNNRCILKIITGEDHECIKTNDDILRRIDVFADEHVTDEIISSYPKHDDETDEDYKSRLHHIIMHQYFSHHLNEIRCDECIQRWLNSEKW